MTMEVDLDRELMNSFKTMNTQDRDVLINEFLRVRNLHQLPSGPQL